MRPRGGISGGGFGEGMAAGALSVLLLFGAWSVLGPAARAASEAGPLAALVAWLTAERVVTFTLAGAALDLLPLVVIFAIATMALSVMMRAPAP
jgi:hypothetical protein